MSEPQKFSFGDSSVAIAYDNVLVRVLFEPWAVRLVEEYGPWQDKRVLDLATGTGIVAQKLATQLGERGKVIGTDINGEMLSLAKQRCAGLIPDEMFVESPAYPLEISSASMDVVVCQQGFQFFPEKLAAAQEAHRVLSDGGKIIATTWESVNECELFGTICKALNYMGETEMSDMMRVPFDFMPGTELSAHFDEAGFNNVEVKQQERDLVLSGGVKEGIEVAYSTPIGPKLRALSDEKKSKFKNTFSEMLNEMSENDIIMGRMVTNVVTADKPIV
jgi:ubiquinone/menaquinone biosynthesis C-methylase UbiE